MYYHERDQTDFEITLDPKVGTVDVYVATFRDND